jgi:hypothetical protein
LGLVMVTTALVARLLVAYFDWKARLLNRIRAERTEQRTAA